MHRSAGILSETFEARPVSVATQTGSVAGQSLSCVHKDPQLKLALEPQRVEPLGRETQNSHAEGQAMEQIVHVPLLHEGAVPAPQVPHCSVPPHPSGTGPHPLPRLAHVAGIHVQAPDWQVPLSQAVPFGAITHFLLLPFFLQTLHGPHPPLHLFLVLARTSSWGTPRPIAAATASTERREGDWDTMRERRSNLLESTVHS